MIVSSHNRHNNGVLPLLVSAAKSANFQESPFLVGTDLAPTNLFHLHNTLCSNVHGTLSLAKALWIILLGLQSQQQCFPPCSTGKSVHFAVS